MPHRQGGREQQIAAAVSKRLWAPSRPEAAGAMAEEEESFDEEASGEEEAELPPWNENVIVRPAPAPCFFL